MTDTQTTIENFRLPADEGALLNAVALAKQAVKSANQTLVKNESGRTVALAENPNAVFTRRVSGSVSTPTEDVRVVMDLNKGKGYLRTRTKSPSSNEIESPHRNQTRTLEAGLELIVKSDPETEFKKSIAKLLAERGLDSEKVSTRRLPNLEFDAVIDGQLMRMRLAQRQTRRNRNNQKSNRDGYSETESDSGYASELTIVGQKPREMSTRSFLLRLHTAHGYALQRNSRWFWAIAVDLMFASMCFWGLSGVVMWWQIKRTRKLGLALLVTSAIVATLLAVGMHWQMVHG